MLTDSSTAARDRFAARASDPVWADHHAEAARQIGKSGGFEGMYEGLMSVLDQLPDAVVITTSAGRIDEACAAVLAAIA